VPIEIATAGGAAVRPLTEHWHTLYVELPRPRCVPAIGVEASAAAVGRALRHVGLTTEDAAVNVAAAEQLPDPAGD
jgi:hypothetical protein